MKLSLFDYNLPKNLIAQKQIKPRDHSRLLVLDRKTGKTSHRRFDDIVDELRTGDVLVFNVTKVFKARLREGKQELFLLKVRDGEAECLIRPGKKYPAGSTLSFFGHDFLIATVSPAEGSSQPLMVWHYAMAFPKIYHAHSSCIHKT